MPASGNPNLGQRYAVENPSGVVASCEVFDVDLAFPERDDLESNLDPQGELVFLWRDSICGDRLIRLTESPLATPHGALAVTFMAEIIEWPRAETCPLGGDWRGARIQLSVTAAPTPAASPTPVEWVEPDAYKFTLESTCGERALIGTFNVEVQDGETVGVQAMSGYFVSHPANMPPSAVPTLNDLLAEAEDARSRDAEQVSVVLDPIDGHPVWISIDWRADTIDDESCYEITNYSPA